jgi:hypothetical protein
MTGPVVTNAEFLEALFADLPDGAAAMLCGFVGDPYAPPEFAWHARPWMHGDALPRNIVPSANNYAAVSSFVPDETGRYRRRKAQFARLHAVMIDDVGTKVQVHRLRLDASARVETSPGNFQEYLFVEPSADSDSRETAETLIEQLVAHGLTADGRDPGMKGVTRVGRLPVGTNAKRKYVEQLGHPFACRLAAWRPERRYTVETIARAFGLDLTVRRREPAPLPPGTALSRVGSFAALMRTIGVAGLYLETLGDGWHAIVCPWVHTHTDRAETGSAVREPCDENRWAGGFRCHHGHCDGRRIGDLYRWAEAFNAEREVAA